MGEREGHKGLPHAPADPRQRPEVLEDPQTGPQEISQPHTLQGCHSLSGSFACMLIENCRNGLLLYRISVKY